MQNTLVFHTPVKEKHVYTLAEADKILSVDDVLKLPFNIYCQDMEAMKVITYQLRKHSLTYCIDIANLCVRR